jgi:Fe-S cluster assembly protein SufD
LNAALQSYVDGYRNLPAAPAWLRPVQDAALERAVKRGFPAARDEAWKYTSVAALEKRAFKPAITAGNLSNGAFDALLIPGLDSPRAVFVDGRYVPEFSRLPAGVRAIPLIQADETLRDSLKVPTEWQDDTFINLNTALFRDGLLLEINAGQILEVPLELLHVSTAEAGAAAHNLRFMLRLARGASACIIERHHGLEGTKCFNNVVTQVELAEDAKLTHVRIQAENLQAFHVGRILVCQTARSEYRSHNLQVGGSWSRLDLHVRLEAEGAHAELKGLYAVTGRQHVDNHTRVDHLACGTVSRELYRGVLDGQGRAVFNGKVVVAPHAIKTDAQQANHNLILSRGAEIDTKPELEIYADDVKCSHGATIGQLDEQQLFYLRSRGLDAETARSLLVSAFVEQLLLELPHPALAAHARGLLGKAIAQIRT